MLVQRGSGGDRRVVDTSVLGRKFARMFPSRLRRTRHLLTVRGPATSYAERTRCCCRICCGMTASICAEATTMAVLVTNDFPPNHGGIQRFLSRLAQELCVAGEPVVVVAPQITGSAQFDAAQKYRVVRYAQRGRAISFFAMTAALFMARLTTKDPVTIASMWFPGGLAACIVPKFMRGRLGVIAHGTEIAPEKGGVRRLLMRYVFARADVIIANSSFTRDLLLSAGVKGDIAVVHPGIDAQAIDPARAAEPTIVSVGRLIARKGFDRIIAALPEILAHYPTARYEIVGAGPQSEELHVLADRLGVRAHVHFLGSVSDADMHAAYARAWCFALPARKIGNDVEGFGLVYLEAALADLPAIGGRNSGAEDAIAAGETGLLVDGDASGEIAAAIVSLFDDPQRAARMGARGRQRALDEFTWKRTAAAIAALMAGRPVQPTVRDLARQRQ